MGKRGKEDLEASLVDQNPDQETPNITRAVSSVARRIIGRKIAQTENPTNRKMLLT